MRERPQHQRGHHQPESEAQARATDIGRPVGEVRLEVGHRVHDRIGRGPCVTQNVDLVDAVDDQVGAAQHEGYGAEPIEVGEQTPEVTGQTASSHGQREGERGDYGGHAGGERQVDGDPVDDAVPSEAPGHVQ